MSSIAAPRRRTLGAEPRLAEMPGHNGRPAAMHGYAFGDLHYEASSASSRPAETPPESDLDLASLADALIANEFQASSKIWNWPVT